MCATNCMNFSAVKIRFRVSIFHVRIRDTQRLSRNSAPPSTITVVVIWHQNLTAPCDISFINQPINICSNICTLLLEHRLK
jgi:hypothetical protein